MYGLTTTPLRRSARSRKTVAPAWMPVMSNSGALPAELFELVYLSPLNVPVSVVGSRLIDVGAGGGVSITKVNWAMFPLAFDWSVAWRPTV